MHFTRPGELINSYIKSKPFPNLPEYRTAYFLFFKLRIATTSDAKVSKIMNSSYVLIKYHTFLQTRERVGARPSASRVNVLLSWCGAAARIGLSIRPAGRVEVYFTLGGFRPAGRELTPIWVSAGFSPCSANCAGANDWEPNADQ